MLPATFKLCCGISHDHLRRITGLKRTAMAAIGHSYWHDLQGIMLKGSHCLPSKLPGYVQRLMWKDTAGTQEDGTGISSGWFSSTELSFVNQGEVTLHRAMQILQQQNGWQMETKQGNGDAVLSTVIPQLGKVFRIEVVLAVPMDQLYHELFESLERMPEWNPTLSQVKILQRIGMDTLLTHEIASQSPGNLVGQRDFVNIRRCWKKETAVYLVGTAACSELIPLQEERVRAEATLSCIVLQPLEENPTQTRFTWLLSMDLKGWIPKSVINYVLPQSQADFIKHLRQHLSLSA